MTAAFIESILFRVLWLAVAVTVLVVNTWTLREAWIDRRIIIQSLGGPANRILAHKNARDEAITYIVQVALLAVHLVHYAMAYHIAPGSQCASAWMVSAVIVLGVQCLMAFGCVWDLRDRRRAIYELSRRNSRVGDVK
jgi:hypothetical protein